MSEEMYIAKAMAVEKIYDNGLTEKGELIGTLLVKPVVKKGIVGKKKIIGFNEAVTDEALIKREYYFNALLEHEVHEDLDSRAILGKPQPDNIMWEVVDRLTADKIFSEEEIQRYLATPKEELKAQIEEIKTKAREIGRANVASDKSIDGLGIKR